MKNELKTKKLSTSKSSEIEKYYGIICEIINCKCQSGKIAMTNIILYDFSVNIEFHRKWKYIILKNILRPEYYIRL